MGTYFFTGSVVAYYGEGIVVGAFSEPYIVGIGATFVEIGFKSTVMPFTPAGMPTIIAGLFLDVTHTNNGDVLEVLVRFIVNTNEPKTYMMSVDAHFQFNHGTNEFDLVFLQAVLTAILSSSFDMVKIFKAGDLVYM